MACRINRLAAQIAPIKCAGNKQFLIAEVPKGPLAESNFALRDGDPPSLKEGEVLLKTMAFYIGAGQRAGLQGSASYAGASKGTDGTIMNATGVGRVAASNSPKFAVGDLVMGGTGWQEQVALPAKALTKVLDGTDPAVMLGALGINGLTAYFGLLEIGNPQPGETVVVSAAAGSVGHQVGQIAKIKGCRVVGIAGSTEKCDRLINELGFDAAVNYKSPTFRDDYKAATPNRIDVYFDNTGGPILESSLFRMNTHGRIVCCGNVSGYDTATPGGGPRGVPGLLVNNQVKMEGFIVYSYSKKYAAARGEISKWVNEGKLTPWVTVYDGLEKAPGAFVDLLAGVTTGTTVVRVAN